MPRILMALLISMVISSSSAGAFDFARPSEGDVVVAGSRLKVLIDPGKIDPLFGVLLTASRGIVKPKLDSLPPFKWELIIPDDYYGPLSLRATGRRYTPVPNPPSASVTIFVVYPAIQIQDFLSEKPGRFP